MELNDKAREDMLKDTVVDMIMLIATTAKAHPETEQAMTVLREALGRLLTLTVGPEWTSQHEADLDTRIKDAVERLRKAALQGSADVSAA